MNVETLFEVSSFLIEEDERLGIQRSFTDLRNALTNLAAQPQNTAFQNSVSEFQRKLVEIMETFDLGVTPGKSVLISEIEGDRFFGVEFTEEIDEAIEGKGLTPAVASSAVSTLYTDRTNYLSYLTSLKAALGALGFQPRDRSPGEVELGVLIPRTLFDNELGALSKELSTINHIIRTFEEVTTGSTPSVEVRQISTSDPTFVLGIPVVTLLALGQSVDWLTKKWREIEEIRHIRAETKKLNIEAALAPIDQKIEEVAQIAVQQERNRLIAEYNGSDKGRKKELSVSLEWALESLMARIERGLTIEVRLLAPPDHEAEKGAESQKVYQALTEIAKTLQAESFEYEEPVFRLPPPTPPTEDDSSAKRGKAPSPKE